MPLFAAYVRVSRRGDRDELRSPDFQQTAIRTYAEQHGFGVEWLPPEIDAAAGCCPAPATIPAAKLEPVVESVVPAHLREEWAEACERGGDLQAAIERRDQAKRELAAFVAQESALGEYFAAGFEQRKGAVDDAENAVRRLRGNGAVPASQSVTATCRLR